MLVTLKYSSRVYLRWWCGIFLC